MKISHTNLLSTMYSLTIASLLVFMAMLFVETQTVFSAPTPTLNYQGKLVDTTNVAVPDGTYNMRFWLTTSASIATTSAVWTESLTGTNRVQVTNGLFSIMLGSTSPLTSVDFNQPLYLGVEIGSTTVTAQWDGEMSPRKILGTVPAAFEADRLDGLTSTQFARTDATTSVATSSTDTLFTITQNGTGDIFNLFDGATEVFSVLDGGNVGVGTSSPIARFMVAGNSYFGGGITATGTISAAGLTVTASSTLGYASTTALTVSGNSFFTYASTTAVSGTNASFTYASTTGISGTNANITNATSTTLAATGSFKIGSDVITDITGTNLSITNGVLSAAGDGVSNWSYNGTYLTPTTTGAGIGIFGSSTIGDGTATGGLTISGGATTTGNAYFGGNVGIGTTNPGAKLEVVGSLTVSGAGDIYATGGNIQIASGYTFRNLNDDLRLVTQTAKDIIFVTSATSEKMRITDGGSVGIGTTTPSATLSVMGTTTRNLFAFASSTGSILLALDSRGALMFGTTTNADIFVNGGAVASRVQSNSNNVAIGNQAFSYYTAGSAIDNIGLGYQALYGAVGTPMTGDYNIGIGTSVLRANTTGSNNIGLGYRALYSNQSADGNIGIGTEALNAVTTGGSNTAVGYQALKENITTQNTALGYQALLWGSGGNNTAIGFQAHAGNVSGISGSYNTALGSQALTSNVGGSSNVAIGAGALLNNNGSFNTVVGRAANAGVSGSSYNTGLGYQALTSSSGSHNTAIGYQALFSSTGAGSTTALGTFAGYTITTGAFNLFLGDEADAARTSLMNGTALGSHAKVGASNSLVLGGTGIWNTNIVTGTNTPFAKFSIQNNYGSTTALFDIATTTSATYATSSLFRVGHDGRVGIGTSSPYATLTVVGSLGLTGELHDRTASAGTSGMVLQTTGSGVQWVATSSLGLSSGAGDGVSNWSYNGTRLTPTTTGAGIGIFGSSTIGGGTGATGLTISGGATTTGNAYFGGMLTVGTTTGTSTVINKLAIGSVTSGVTKFEINDTRTLPSSGNITQFLNDANWTLPTGASGTYILFKNDLTTTGDLGSATVYGSDSSVTLGSDASSASVIGTRNLISESNDGNTATYTSISGTQNTISLGETINDVAATAIYGTQNNIIRTASPSSAKTIGSIYGTHSSLTHMSSAGVVSNYYGSHASLTRILGTVSNAYGFYADMGTTNASTTYGVYVNGDTQSYFGGKVGIGSSTPSRSLTVAGDIYTTNNITAASSTLGYASTTALTVSGNSYFTYASTTAVSGTNLSFTNATSTTLAATGSFKLGSDVITDITGTNLSVTNGILSAAGDGVSNWSYNGTRLTPTTTGAGIGIFGSSTIGGGTGATGLTISGGATTTGNAYFAGLLGVGTNTPTAKFALTGTAGQTSSLFRISSSTEAILFDILADGSVDIGQGGLYYNASTNETTIENLQLGAVNFATDAGAVSWVDMIASGTPTSTVLSYSAQLDGTSVLTVYGESNGQGGVQNLRVGIGSTSPSSMLSVTGSSGSNLFSFASSTGSTLLALDRRGVLTFGTTTSADIFLNGGAATTTVQGFGGSVVIGNQAFSHYTQSAYGNIALGYQALYGSSTALMSGHNNFAAGYQALKDNTSGSDNNAFGSTALLSNRTGVRNNALGSEALTYNTSGSDNNAFGYQSLWSNISGQDNNAFGVWALGANTTGVNNIAIGGDDSSYESALGSNTTGSHNTALGLGSLYSNTTGSYNNAIGYYAGNANTTGTSTSFFGYKADALTGALSTSTALGAGAKVGCSNCLVLGGTGQDAVKVGIGTSTPWKTLSIIGDLSFTGGLFDSASSSGSNGMVLQTTGSGVQWVATSTLGLSSGAGDGVSNWSYNGTRLTPTTTGAGIGIFGSSTIGGGTGSTGLTISGGATTTGNAYFAGNVGIGIAPSTSAALLIEKTDQEATLSLLDGGVYSGQSAYGIYNEMYDYNSGRNVVGLYNKMTTSYGTTKLTGVENRFLPQSGSTNTFYGVKNGGMLSVDGDATTTLYGMYTYASSSDIAGPHVVYGAYTDITSENDAFIQKQYGTYAIGTTYADDVFYGNYVTSSSTTSGGTQYGTYVDLTPGTGTKYAGIFLGGNVGIGSSSPTTKLTVAGAEDTALIALGDTTNNDRASIFTGTTSPNGRVSAQIGSLFVDTVSGELYQKTGDDGGNTSWEPFTQGTTTHMAKVARAAAQSIGSGFSDVKIAFDTIEFDTGGIADITTNDRIDIKKRGKYIINGQWTVPNLDTGEFVEISIYVNGAVHIFGNNESEGANYSVPVETTTILELDPGDYIEMYVRHLEGASQNTFTTDVGMPRLSVIEIAPNGGGADTLYTDAGSDTYLTSTSDNLLIGTSTNAALAKFVLTQQNASDIVNIFDGTTEVFTILDGGNVGIGSSSPSRSLTVAGDAYFGYASSTGMSGTNLNFTNATSTNIAATGSFKIGSDVITDITGTNLSVTNGTLSAAGDGVSNWSYNGTRLTPTTTGAGIGIFGSSTIGGGTGATGLTINGGATTTGNAYFGGRIGIGTTTPSATLSLVGTTTLNLFNFASSTGSTLLALDRRGALNFGVAGTDANIYINGGPTSTPVGNSISNVAIGNEAFSFISAGGDGATDNIAMGYQALFGSSSVLMTGDGNTAFGYQSLYTNTTGSHNNALGVTTLVRNTTGSSNNALGYQALLSNVSGSYNNALGYQALGTNESGTDNNAFGRLTLLNNTTGSHNIGVGYLALRDNTIGGNNTAFGNNALRDNISGNDNIALGQEALFHSTTTSENIAIGIQSMGYSTVSGSGNVGLGAYSLGNLTRGEYNTAIGYNALSSNYIGAYNTALGYQAGSANTIGTSTLFLGYNAGNTGTLANLYNAAAIGSNAQVRRSHAMVLGGTGIWNTDIVTGTTTPFAKFSIQNNYGSTTALFDIATTTSAAYATSSLFRVGHDGRVSIGSTTPESLLLTLQKTGITGSGINGIKEYLQFTNSTQSAVYYGDAAYIVNAPTATSTLVGKIIRVEDSTALGNTVRGLEVQAHRGTNTKGENTGINAFGRTFGIKGTTEGDAGDTYAPAGVYAESRGTTQGNALRAYSGSLTTAALVSLFHDTSAFTGTGLLMNFGNAGGSFAATTSAKFIDLQVGGTSKFFVAANGSTTIGDGTINAGLIIPRGGICVDNDGSCVSTTTGEIRSVTSALGNSDLAEMYFSSDALETGEIVSLAGGLSISRTDDTNNALIIGVVSTKPGLTLGFDDTSLMHGEAAYPVALKGRVPIRLSTENGPIVKGDRIALSSIPGIGMKATESDTIVGIALEDYDGERAYSEGFLNQFGDDLVKVKITERNRNTDIRTQDGCYFGGGVEEGEEECDPLAVKTIKPKVITIDERTEVLAALADESAEDAVTPDGETVTLGQALMFVQLEEHIAGKDMDVLTALNATSTLLNGNGEETLFDRLKELAQGFVDGVLRVAGIRTDELCIGETCVDEATLKALLRDHADSASSPPPAPPEPSDDEEVDDPAVETPPDETIQEEDTEGESLQDEAPTDETEENVVEEETPAPPEEPAVDPEPTPTPESTPTE